MPTLQRAMLIAPWLWILSVTAQAQQAELNHDYVERAVLTSGMANREPVDDLGHTYQHSGDAYDRLTFFTQIMNHDGRAINHRWYRNGELDSEVTLAIGSNSWRTYSTRQISSMATGDWSIRVVNDGGDELVHYSFSVQR